jgi:hypothetical protein
MSEVLRAHRAALETATQAHQIHVPRSNLPALPPTASGPTWLRSTPAYAITSGPSQPPAHEDEPLDSLPLLTHPPKNYPREGRPAARHEPTAPARPHPPAHALDPAPAPLDDEGRRTDQWVPDPWPTSRSTAAPRRPSGAEPRRATRALPASSGGRHRLREPEPEPHERPITRDEATWIACAFALDLTSWDEDNPQRRGDVLARYLPAVVDVDRLGWDGQGRQRSETAIPGEVTHVDESHVRVDVRVRVTPYVRQHGVAVLHPTPVHEPGGGAVYAAAPAPSAAGWIACDSEWVRLVIPVARNADGSLVIDLGSAESDADDTSRSRRGAC